MAEREGFALSDRAQYWIGGLVSVAIAIAYIAVTGGPDSATESAPTPVATEGSLNPAARQQPMIATEAAGAAVSSAAPETAEPEPMVESQTQPELPPDSGDIQRE